MPSIYKYSIEDLKKISQEFAEKATPPFSILLEGDVGVGKTAFSKFFIETLLTDKSQNVTSPTFNIVQIYETKKGPIWHVDLYRIKKEEEIFQLGLLEAMHESICLIEWPELLRKYISDCNYTVIDLQPKSET